MQRKYKKGLFPIIAGRDKAHIAVAGGAVQLDGIGKDQFLLLDMGAVAHPVAFGAGDIVFTQYSGGKNGMHAISFGW